ncbi:trypsin-like serine protease [Kitasatospora sp. NPDC058965]|uniref:trypsin-like serine protease n=1 Tax=Kitasatospora sp. NPDC058965 TaxID=3346682 RepID=UPI003677E98F
MTAVREHRLVRALVVAVTMVLALALGGTVTPASAVTGGGRVTTGQYPWMIHFRDTSKYGLFSYSCGGVLIAPTKVLTAGHCGREYQGKLDHAAAVQGQTNILEGGREYSIGRIDISPQFTPDQEQGAWKTYDIHWGDVAVFTLNYPMTGVPTIPFAHIPADETLSGNGLILGWSLENIDSNGDPRERLRSSMVPILPDSACTRPYGSLFKSGQMICAGDAQHDACNGDSGGPLIRNGWVVGIISGGGNNGCDQAGYPGTYARVAAYSNWIQQMKEDVDHAPFYVNGKCLDADVAHGSVAGMKAQLWDCNGWRNQFWYTIGDHIFSAYNSMCLTADASGGDRDGMPIVLEPCNWSDVNQQFRIDAYTITSVRNGKCLDADIAAGYRNGMKIQLWGCNGWDNQKFW